MRRAKQVMIKTLRITGVLAAVLGAGFFVVPAVLGSRGDEKVEKLLSSAGVIEEFKKAEGNKAKVGKSQTPPLVKQAEDFARYLNPPPKRRETAAVRTKLQDVRPPKVAAKFNLLGISYYSAHPELSLALIDEVGKGTSWVRQSGTVGHLLIEQIKEGAVVVRDNERTFEMVPEKEPRRSLLKGSSPAETGSKPVSSAVSRGGSDVNGSVPSGREPSRGRASRGRYSRSRGSHRKPSRSETPPTGNEGALMEKLLRDIQAMKAGYTPERGDSKAEAEEDGTKVMKKMISDIEAMRISAAEAKRLGHLGQELKNGGRDANHPKGGGSKLERSSRKPSSPSKD